MGNSVFTRIGINRAIGLPHPFWNSLGKARQAMKATAYLETRSNKIDSVSSDVIREHSYLQASYTRYYTNKLRSGEISLSDFLLKYNEWCSRDCLIGPALIELGQATAVKLAGELKPEILETKIGTWQELSRVPGKIREGVQHSAGCPSQDIPPGDDPYKDQEVTTTAKGDLRVETTFGKARSVLAHLINMFPENADLFSAMLQAIPQDRVDILKDQVRVEESWINIL